MREWWRGPRYGICQQIWWWLWGLGMGTLALPLILRSVWLKTESWIPSVLLIIYLFPWTTIYINMPLSPSHFSQVLISSAISIRVCVSVEHRPSQQGKANLKTERMREGEMAQKTRTSLSSLQPSLLSFSLSLFFLLLPRQTLIKANLKLENQQNPLIKIKAPHPQRDN